MLTGLHLELLEFARLAASSMCQDVPSCPLTPPFDASFVTDASSPMHRRGCLVTAGHVGQSTTCAHNSGAATVRERLDSGCAGGVTGLRTRGGYADSRTQPGVAHGEKPRRVRALRPSGGSGLRAAKRVSRAEPVCLRETFGSCRSVQMASGPSRDSAPSAKSSDSPSLVIAVGRAVRQATLPSVDTPLDFR